MHTRHIIWAPSCWLRWVYLNLCIPYLCNMIFAPCVYGGLHICFIYRNKRIFDIDFWINSRVTSDLRRYDTHETSLHYDGCNCLIASRSHLTTAHNISDTWFQISIVLAPAITSYWDHIVHAPSQWETMLQCNVGSHLMGAYTKLSLNSRLLMTGKLCQSRHFLWCDWAPFYWHGLTLISAWISNHMPSKVWNGITYPSLNFNGCTVEV